MTGGEGSDGAAGKGSLRTSPAITEGGSGRPTQAVSRFWVSFSTPDSFNSWRSSARKDFNSGRKHLPESVTPNTALISARSRWL